MSNLSIKVIVYFDFQYLFMVYLLPFKCNMNSLIAINA